MEQFKTLEIKSALKRLAKQKGLKYEDLAEQLDCSVPTVKRALGNEELTLSRLLEFCEILNVSLTDLERMSERPPEKREKFTDAQDQFLAKNRGHFAYLMQLFAGQTPRQIAETNGLSQRSTDKYLIALEKHELIRVTGKQRVKPNFKSVPSLGDGLLGRAYFRSLVNASGQFFIGEIQDEMQKPPSEKKGTAPATFAIWQAKITPANYLEWVARQEKAMRELDSLASFDEKSNPEAELQTLVLLRAHVLSKSDNPRLKTLEQVLGEIVNLA